MQLAADIRGQANNVTDPEERARLNAEADRLQSQWGESGNMRVLAHTVIGGLIGGVGGAAGAAAGTLTAPKVAEALREAGMTGPLADVLTGVASTAAGAAVGGAAGAAAGMNEVVNNYLNHQEISRLQAELRECKLDKNCMESTVEKYAEISVGNNERLAAVCAGDPSGSACQNGVREALNYVGNHSWKFYESMPMGLDREQVSMKIDQMNSDIDSSRKSVLDVVFGDRQAYGAVNDIDSRADFFDAMYSQTGAIWFKAAADQSRENLSGLKFELGELVSKAFGKGNVMGDWRSAAGNRIMASGLSNFMKIYYDKSLDPVGWSIGQLVNEQRDASLQQIHEYYIPKMLGGMKEGMEFMGG